MSATNSASLNISCNGKPKMVSETNLGLLLKAWGYQVECIAVAVNGEFVPRTAYVNTELTKDDKVDVVTAMQGG